ncbi:MAG TPA: universal stress protein [Acidimicrobiales bacterium]|nr:universal stress protein [Acidimicrobiales bacterium]
MFKTILVAADDSVTAARALSTAVELVKAVGGSLHVVTAYNPSLTYVEVVPDDYIGTLNNAADLLLEKLRKRIGNEGVEAQYHRASGPIADAIVRVADDIGADLIVVGNKGMKGVRRVLGSVPNSVAHQADCSVLIVDTLNEE